MKARFAALLALAVPATGPARPPDAGLCSALENLRRDTRRTGRTQRVFVITRVPFTFACGHTTGRQLQRSFCRAARRAVGLEFLHAFPWEVHDCLRAQDVTPSVETTDRYTGLPNRARLAFLSAAWPDGVRLEIRYRPDEEDRSDDPQLLQFEGDRGQYVLTLSRPRRR